MAGSRNRKNIKRTEAAVLWAASAGRCNICNTSLLRDATTGVEVNAGEMAHIVGVSDGPRSIRGQDPLTREGRALAKNLILLCADHHTEIDKRPDVYSVEHLRGLKKNFEERVFSLTSLGEPRATQILRVLGSIRGEKVPDLSREEARELVLREDRRYPHFTLGPTEQDAAIDLTDLADEGSEAYWEQARKQIKKKAAQIADRVADGDAEHISVVALARIPVLVMLGVALSDATNVTVYHRRNQEGWGWDSDAVLPQFEVVKIRDGEHDEGIVLACSIAARVRENRIPEQLNGRTLYELRPVDGNCGAALFDHRESQRALGKVYRNFLSSLERDHPKCRSISLLPAIPADAAVILGQIRTPGVTPTLEVYDLQPAEESYAFAVEVGS